MLGPGHGSRHKADDHGVDDELARFEKGNVGVAREGPQEVALADVPKTDKCLADSFPGREATFEGFIQLGLRDQARFDERLAEPNSARHV